jgi:Glycosyltransferases, probably involved in cell wall biogenesis
MRGRTVTVIIPTYKPDQLLMRLIKQIKEQTYNVERILVMNTEEQYWKPAFEKITNKMEVFHIKKAAFDHGRTRDEAAQMVDSDIMIYLTQDACLQDENVFSEMLKFFDRQKVKAVYARQLPQKNCKTIESYTRAFNYPDKTQIKSKSDLDKLGIKTYFCSNVCAAYDRDTYVKLGGFVKRAIFNEDMIYAGKLINAGYRIAYAAKACVIHSHNYNNLEQLRRNFDVAVSQVEHPEVFAGIKSEGEGIRLVKQTAGYLWQSHKPWLIGALFVSSACKYLGYWLGKHYRILPRKWIMKLTMNPEYWKDFTVY